jgi:phage terminase small subunit
MAGRGNPSITPMAKIEKTRKLTPKQAAFCAEYLIDLNATQAAIRAGYSVKTAASQGERLLRNVEIQNGVQQMMAARAEQVELTAAGVLDELASLAFFDPGELGSALISGPADLAKLPEKVRRAIVGWNWDRAGNFTLKLADKLRALDLVGQHLGMWRTKVEHTGKDGGPLVMENPRPSIEAVAEFSNALFEGFRTFRHEETGEAAELDQQALNSLAEIVADFSAAGDRHGVDAANTGHMLAMGWVIRKNLRPPASYLGKETDP